ncbi:SPOSA6832_03352, partial [Sporobolomyces salmonicolor]
MGLALSFPITSPFTYTDPSSLCPARATRNHEAKKFLKSQMKVGHLCLFYASNCKLPGVTGIARVIKEGYPDHNAWDPKHPYYDVKSKPDDPTWFMVDVQVGPLLVSLPELLTHLKFPSPPSQFVSRLPHLVPLALLQHLSTLSAPPASLSYLTPSHLAAIADSPLIKRGRLSVQPAGDEFFEAVRTLGENGGFERVLDEIKGAKGKGGKGRGKSKPKAGEQEQGDGEGGEPEGAKADGRAKGRVGAGKRKTRAASKKGHGDHDQEEGDGGEDELEEKAPGRDSRPKRRKT